MKRLLLNMLVMTGLCLGYSVKASEAINTTFYSDKDDIPTIVDVVQDEDDSIYIIYEDTLKDMINEIIAGERTEREVIDSLRESFKYDFIDEGVLEYPTPASKLSHLREIKYILPVQEREKALKLFSQAYKEFIDEIRQEEAVADPTMKKKYSQIDTAMKYFNDQLKSEENNYEKAIGMMNADCRALLAIALQSKECIDCDEQATIDQDKNKGFGQQKIDEKQKRLEDLKKRTQEKRKKVFEKNFATVRTSKTEVPVSNVENVASSPQGLFARLKAYLSGMNE